MADYNSNYTGQEIDAAVKGVLEPFTVVLTPTAQDYSGTMDKTVGEINAAYEAGRRIVFRVHTSATAYIEVECIMRGREASAGDYPSFNAFVINEQNNVLIYMFTGIDAVASRDVYSTKLYPLTPMT